MSKTSTALVEIPSGFGEVTEQFTLPEFNRLPYVQFVSSKSQNYAELLTSIHGLKEGEPVLNQPAPEGPVPLRPFEYFLLQAREYWGQFNQAGEILAVSSAKPSDPNANPKWDQVIEALVLVILEDRLVPATCRFKKTKCPAVYPALRALGEAGTEAWAKKGKEYAFTMGCPDLWARFYTRAVRTERPNRSSGIVYPTMEAIVKPTTAALFTALADLRKSPEQMKKLQEVLVHYKDRLAKVLEKEVVTA